MKKEIEMKSNLLKFQQAELDAVLMYKKLAMKVKNEDLKVKFLEAAKDEGKHGAILKKLTGEILMPKSSKATIISFILKIFGLKTVLKLISNGEFKAAEKYVPYVKVYPEIEEIRKDEIKHGEIFRQHLLK